MFTPVKLALIFIIEQNIYTEYKGRPGIEILIFTQTFYMVFNELLQMFAFLAMSFIIKSEKTKTVQVVEEVQPDDQDPDGGLQLG